VSNINPRIIRLAPKTQCYTDVRYDGHHSKFDVVDQRFNYPAIVPVTFPAAWGYWKFEEEGTTLLDSSGNGHNLIEANTETTSRITGLLGNCVKGDKPVGGNQGYLECNVETPVSLPQETPWSFVVWHKFIDGESPNNGDPLQIYFPPYDNCFGIYTLGSLTSATLYVTCDIGDISVSYNASETYDHGNWSMFTVTFDGMYVKLYRNTTLIWTSMAVTFATPGNLDWDHVLFMPGVGRICQSYIDEAGIYNGVAFTVEQIAQLWNSGAGWSPY
jgi:hypothetical protein